MAAGASIALRVGPISDIDVYWHVVAGRQIMAGVPLDHVGSSWLADGLPHPWTSSQWLSEVAMAFAVDHGGWSALVVGKELLVLAALISCAAATMYKVPARVGAPVFSLTALALAVAVQERPQTASFIFLPLVGLACARLWIGAERPPWWLVAALCILWANLHGLWILAPAAFGLAFVLLAVSERRWRDGRPGGALVMLAASLAGLANPLGVKSLLLPLAFRNATGQIGEWELTTPWLLPYAGFDLLVLLTVVAWARRRPQVTLFELGWVVCWGLFALMAHRNVCTAALLIAPVTATAVNRTWRAGVAKSSARERKLLALTAALLVAVSLVWTWANTAGGRPLDGAKPLAIAERLAGSPHPLRVFNSYNTSGVLVAFSNGKARLAIDGRADLWGDKTIAKAVAVPALDKGWRQTLTSFHPEALVIEKDSALSELLHAIPTVWYLAQTDHEYSLWLRHASDDGPLVPPAQPR